MNKTKQHILKSIATILVIVFSITTVYSPSYAQGLFSHQALVSLSPGFTPALVRGIKVYPNNPFQFDFIVDSGDSGLTDTLLKQESEKLIRYFLASLTVPEQDLWVNLSPYESDRIIPEELGKTEMGIDMLAQDYLLKQITASLMNPEDDIGRQFWQKVYKQAYEQYGTTDIPVDTFNKVWIMPDKAEVYVQEDRAFILEAKLKVMLEEDYVALQENNVRAQIKDEKGSGVKSMLASSIIRDIIIPALEQEVNHGQNFASLRQIYHSLILAHWYKTALKDSILNKVYSDQGKISGIDLSDKAKTDAIYQSYLETFKQGVFSMIRVEYDHYSRRHIPRRYFAGGVAFFGGLDEAMIPIENIEYVKVRETKGLAYVIEAIVSKNELLFVAEPETAASDYAMRSENKYSQSNPNIINIIGEYYNNNKDIPLIIIDDSSEPFIIFPEDTGRNNEPFNLAWGYLTDAFPLPVGGILGKNLDLKIGNNLDQLKILRINDKGNDYLVFIGYKDDAGVLKQGKAGVMQIFKDGSWEYLEHEKASDILLRLHYLNLYVVKLDYNNAVKIKSILDIKQKIINEHGFQQGFFDITDYPSNLEDFFQALNESINMLRPEDDNRRKHIPGFWGSTVKSILKSYEKHKDKINKILIETNEKSFVLKALDKEGQIVLILDLEVRKNAHDIDQWTFVNRTDRLIRGQSNRQKEPERDQTHSLKESLEIDPLLNTIFEHSKPGFIIEDFASDLEIVIPSSIVDLLGADRFRGQPREPLSFITISEDARGRPQIIIKLIGDFIDIYGPSHIEQDFIFVKYENQWKNPEEIKEIEDFNQRFENVKNSIGDYFLRPNQRQPIIFDYEFYSMLFDKNSKGVKIINDLVNDLAEARKLTRYMLPTINFGDKISLSNCKKVKFSLKANESGAISEIKFEFFKENQEQYRQVAIYVRSSDGKKWNKNLISLNNITDSGVDQASVDSSIDLNLPTGGIDFTIENIPLVTQGQDVNFSISIDFENLTPQDIQGLVPVIINVVPIKNINMFLGFESTPGFSST